MNTHSSQPDGSTIHTTFKSKLFLVMWSVLLTGGRGSWKLEMLLGKGWLRVAARCPGPRSAWGWRIPQLRGCQLLGFSCLHLIKLLSF